METLLQSAIEAWASRLLAQVGESYRRQLVVANARSSGRAGARSRRRRTMLGPRMLCPLDQEPLQVADLSSCSSDGVCRAEIAEQVGGDPPGGVARPSASRCSAGRRRPHTCTSSTSRSTTYRSSSTRSTRPRHTTVQRRWATRSTRPCRPPREGHQGTDVGSVGRTQTRHCRPTRIPVPVGAVSSCSRTSMTTIGDAGLRGDPYGAINPWDPHTWGHGDPRRLTPSPCRGRRIPWPISVCRTRPDRD